MEEIDALSGFEVHYCQPESGRLIVVQETTTGDEQQQGLRRLQALPRVKLAALVEHRIDREAGESGGP